MSSFSREIFDTRRMPPAAIQGERLLAAGYARRAPGEAGSYSSGRRPRRVSNPRTSMNARARAQQADRHLRFTAAQAHQAERLHHGWRHSQARHDELTSVGEDDADGNGPLSWRLKKRTVRTF